MKAQNPKKLEKHTLSFRVDIHVAETIKTKAIDSHRNLSDEQRMLLDAGMKAVYGKGFK